MNAKKLWGMSGFTVTLMVLALTSCAGLVLAQDDGGDLEELLEDMSGAYAEGYMAPLVSGFGINQNSALYHTAHIPGTTVTISVGLKVMGTKLSDEDQTFSVVETVELDSDNAPTRPDLWGQSGQVVMSGPTVFGSEDEGGQMTVLYHGLPVHSEDLSELTGLVESEFVPLVMPQGSLGGIMGMEATLRWLPDIEVTDGVKVKLWGLGLAASANYWIPTLPVDVKVGFFKQSLDVGDYVETEAKSVYIAASKEYSMLTLYGGLSKESSSMDVTYTYNETDEEIAFSLDGVQGSRMTIGATLNMGLKINGEIGMGDLTSFSGGILLGF